MARGLSPAATGSHKDHTSVIVSLFHTEHSGDRAIVIMSKLDLKDGLLCVDGEPVLLSSTVKLLDFLGYTSPTADLPLRAGGLPPLKAPPVEPPADESIPEENRAYQSLLRVTNANNLLFRALEDVRDVRQRVPGQGGGGGPRRAFGGGRSMEDRRRVALEKSRERLQKQLSDEDNVEDEDAPAEGAWVSLARALNSLKVLTPVLCHMLLHERRNDETLVIGGVKLGNKRKKGCWLLGEVVFDTTAQPSAKRLLEHLRACFVYFGVQKSENDYKVWLERLDAAMQQVCDMSSSDQSSTKPTWVGRLPFADCDDKAAVLEKCNLLDAKMHLAAEKDEAEHARYLKSIDTLHQRMDRLLKQRFPDARLSVYGSCLSDLSLGKAADVDLSLVLDAAVANKEGFESGKVNVNKYQSTVKSLAFRVLNKIKDEKDDFRNLEAIVRARIPVVKGTFVPAENPHTPDGSIDFDICFLNDIAVANSSLLREYSLVDARVKNLMIDVKRWAKENDICSAQTNSLSSYAWMNLVVFYLQCLGFVPNLQSAELMAKLGSESQTEYWHKVNNLKTFYLKWEQVKDSWQQPAALHGLSVTSLLSGFFDFYAFDFPVAIYMVSIKRGQEGFSPKTVFARRSLFLCIEDPFETYDSHVPHDLGTPANEPNMVKIVQCFQESAVYLRDLLLTKSAEAIDGLWPEPVKGPEVQKGRMAAGGRGRNGKVQERPAPAKVGRGRGRGKQNKDNKKSEESGAAETLDAASPASTPVVDAEKTPNQRRRGGKGRGGNKKDESGAATENKPASTDQPAAAKEGGAATTPSKNRKRNNNPKKPDTSAAAIVSDAEGDDAKGAISADETGEAKPKAKRNRNRGKGKVAAKAAAGVTEGEEGVVPKEDESKPLAAGQPKRGGRNRGRGKGGRGQAAKKESEESAPPGDTNPTTKGEAKKGGTNNRNRRGRGPKSGEKQQHGGDNGGEPDIVVIPESS